LNIKREEKKERIEGHCPDITNELV
jgi:hypothetical protein